MEQLGYRIKEFKSWPDAFFHCRKLRNFSITDISRKVGVSRKTVQDWEDGLAFPTKGNVSVRLYGIMHALKAYKHLLPREFQEDPEPTDVRRANTTMGVALEKAEAVKAEAEALAAEAAEPESPRPHKYNEAIKKAIIDAGFSQREVAELIGVNGSSISSWVLGNVVPIADHWAKLVELFPELRVWDPSPKEMEKPGRETGMWTNAGGRPILKTVAPVPDPPVEAARPGPTIADVATSYAIARVKESVAKAEVAKFEERLLELELQRDAAKRIAEEATAEAEEAHRHLLEMATR